MTRLAIALAVWLVAACAAPDQPHRYFVLEASAAAGGTVATAPPREATLLVAPVTAAGFYRSREIVYSRATGTRGYYQFNSWTEPPAIAIGGALMSKLERSHAFRAVAPTASGAEGALLLRVHLDELYHDAATSPGTARIALTAQLSDPRTRGLLDKRSFTASAPASSYDADGAVAGLRQALDQALDELVRWVAATR